MIKQRGFTLVELSIVLVIIGLLVGGVLTGQSLIRAAELRSVTTQEQRYIAATMTFRDKYFALPGDMTNAVAYWGAADGAGGTTAACATTASTTAVTCNGDGNGKIDSSASSNERFRYWQQLANAGLIEGNYNGAAVPTTSTVGTTSANSPTGRISGTFWYLYYRGALLGSSLFDGQYDNTFEFGSANGAVGSEPNWPVLKPEDAYNIDTKLDDGKPATGKVVVNWSVCTDATSGSVLTANYALSTTTVNCILEFKQVF